MTDRLAKWMDAGARFDCALASAEAWRRDAELYFGSRRLWRLDRAVRLARLVDES